MANIFKGIWAWICRIFKKIAPKIVIQWQEWRAYQTSIWNVRRDSKAILRAMARAKEKNARDGRTYFIFRDKYGGINEFNKDDYEFWTRHNPPLLDKMDYMKRLEKAIAIVTSRKFIQEQYNQVQLKKEGTNEQE